MSNVDHPEHYNRGIECIEEMIAVFGKEVVMNFCLCNVWKYRYRASDKNGEEDIEKSDWYMKKYMELAGAPIKINDPFGCPDISRVTERITKEIYGQNSKHIGN